MSKRLTAYGWIPDLPDHRDKFYGVLPPEATQPDITPIFSLRPSMPRVYNQLSLNSCVWNALAALHQRDQMLEAPGKDWTPSRLYGWFWTRFLEGTAPQNAGCAIRDAIKVLASRGICPESEWQYLEPMFAVPPPVSCDPDALANVSLAYERVPQSEGAIKQCLASGFPIIFGATLYDSFESDAVAKTGMVPMPAAGEDPVGGHAQVMIGWNDTLDTQRFEVRNSWDETWGDDGHDWMPFDYVLNDNLASDLWKVTRVQDEAE